MKLRLEIEVDVPDDYVGRRGAFAQALYDEYPSPASLVADWFNGADAEGVLTVKGRTQGGRMMSWRRGRWTKPRPC